MAHMMKHTKATCGHMCAHYDRRANNIGNECVDPERTHLNYNLATHQTMDQVTFIRQRCGEIRCQRRRDVNVMCSWVVTMPHAPLPLFPSSPVLEEDQLERIFFQRVYHFLVHRYGLENVVSAWVHRDETTPHLHFAFVPVTEDLRRGGWKVSAKERVNRQDLRSFHTDLERELAQYGDWYFPVLNDATQLGNLTVAQLKRQSALSRSLSDPEQLRLENRILRQQLTWMQHHLEQLRFSIQTRWPDAPPELLSAVDPSALPEKF